MIASMLGEAGSLRSKLFRGSAGSVFLKMGYIALHVGTSVVLARNLSAADYGTYAFALSLAVILLVPAQFGLPGFLVRSVSDYMARGRHEEVHGLLRRAVPIALLVGIGIATLAAGAVGALGLKPTEMSALPVMSALLLVPILAAAAANDASVRALGYPILGQVPSQFARPAMLLLGAVILVGSDALDPQTAVLANVSASASALLLGVAILHRRIPPDVLASAPRYSVKQWVKGAMPFLFLAGAQTVNHHLDTLMLGVLASPRDVGLYRVAVQVADSLNAVLLAITAVIAPQISRLYSLGDWRTLQRILVASHRFGVVFLTPIAVTTSILGDRVVSIVFGPEYSEAAQPLTILVSGRALYASVGFTLLALSMIGYARAAAVASFLAVGSNVALNGLLIPRLGTSGAALASATTLVGLHMIMAGWMKRATGVNCSAYARGAFTRAREAD